MYSNLHIENTFGILIIRSNRNFVEVYIMEKRRVVLMLDEDAATILERSTSERGKGAFISELLRTAQSGDTGILERMDARLGRIEKLLITGRQ